MDDAEEPSNFIIYNKLKAWVPSLYPRRWLIINTTLVLYSLLQLTFIIIAIRYRGERPDATASYIIWNFSTTLAWWIEAGLEWWWCHRTFNATHGTSSNWWDKYKDVHFLAAELELGLALYYLVDSTHILWVWHIQGEDVLSSMYDVLLNSVFYVYAMTRDFIRVRRIWQRSSDDIESHDSYVELD